MASSASKKCHATRFSTTSASSSSSKSDCNGAQLARTACRPADSTPAPGLSAFEQQGHTLKGILRQLHEA